METILLYFGKMILCSAVMYAYYLLFLKDKTFHHYNRFYLLLTVIISIFLPLLKVSYFTIEVNNKLLLLLTNLQSQPLTSIPNVFNIYTIFSVLFGLVSIFFLTKLIVGLFRINHIKNQFPNEEIEGINFYQTTLEEAPFSFFRHLFWKKSIEINSPIGQQILKHEMVHIEQKHTWDKLFMQLVKAVFWLNPMYYIINKEINLIHEYLADNKAVKRSDTKAFAQMLLASHFPGTNLPATSPFLSSNLKKRLKMLTKSKPKYSYARRIFALPLLFLLSFAYLINAKNKEIKATNIAIDLAVDNLQNDTLNVDRAVVVTPTIIENSQKGLSETNEQIASDNQKIAEINKKIAEKNKSINDLVKAKKTDAPEFDQKVKEVDELANLADGIYNSNRYQDLLKKSIEYSKNIETYYNSPEYLAKMAGLEKRSAEIEAKYNSPEWKTKMAAIEKRSVEIEAKYNSPEWKSKIAAIEKRAKEIEVKYNSPEWKKKMADIEKRSAEIEKRVNSPEFKARIEAAAKSGKNIYFSPDSEAVFGKMFDPKDLATIVDLKDLKFDSLNFNNEEVQKLLKGLPKAYDLNFDDVAVGREMTAKEKRQYEKQQKEIESLQKKLKEKRNELQNNKVSTSSPWIINTNNQTPKSNSTLILNKDQLVINGQDMSALSKDSNYRLFLDGVEVESKDFKNILPKNIAYINVNKSNGKGEIRITSKK